jgi:hypothetical protein
MAMAMVAVLKGDAYGLWVCGSLTGGTYTSYLLLPVPVNPKPWQNEFLFTVLVVL